MRAHCQQPSQSSRAPRAPISPLRNRPCPRSVVNIDVSLREGLSETVVAQQAVVKTDVSLSEGLLDVQERLEGSRAVSLLLQALVAEVHEQLNGESLDQPEHANDSTYVEHGDDQPTAWYSGRFPNGLSYLWHILAEKGDHPHSKGHEEIIEVEREPLPLVPRGFLQIQVWLAQQTAPKLHAQGCEKENHHAQSGQNVLRAHQDLEDRIDHELHVPQPSELLHHA
mmetsp:Transcript_95932/g.243823  ORF Transcript_95932/g.243823 Transcript_95932/m.243823 type:complete len:225 (+) Transcript_95932:92-766(+)